MKEIAGRWRDEKLIEEIRTIQEILENTVKPNDLEKYIMPFKKINDFLFNHKRGQILDNGKEIRKLLNAMEAYSFYPTPEKTCNELYEKISKEFGSDDISLLDIACGLGSLSMPFIKSGNYNSITMVEMNPDFCEYLKSYEQFDKKIKVIESDIFTIPSDKLKCNVIVMNPPFEKTLYLKFILKAIDIAYCNKKNGYIFDLYVICPDTYFKDLTNIPFSKKMLKDFQKDSNIINNEIFADGSLFRQIQDMGPVDGFMKLNRKSVPQPLGVRGIHLYNFFI